MPFDVLLVDDLDETMRKRIKAILSPREEFRVVGEAESGVSALQFIKQHTPGLVLMGIGDPGAANKITSNVFADIGLPGLNAENAEILRHYPECKVVILSMYDDEDLVVRAVRSGARGFIMNPFSPNELLEALRVVADGGAYLSPQVGDRLLKSPQKVVLEFKQDPAFALLSPREIQVLGPVFNGKTSKEIAALIRSYRKAKA